MKNQKKILGTTIRSKTKSLIEFAKFWNSSPSIYEFSKYATGMVLRPQHLYWMAKYPNHNIPLAKLGGK